MAREIIDTSLDEGTVKIEGFFGDLAVTARKNKVKVRYNNSNVKAIDEIDAETYRSLGKTAVASIIGGVLTGGIGLLAGAVFGGRRRSNGSYMIVFDDGEHLAFSEDKNSVIKCLKNCETKIKIDRLKSGS